VERLSVDDTIAKSFKILAISLNILRNYFNSSKLFSDLYLTKFLSTLAKPFFPYITIYTLKVQIKSFTLFWQN